MKLDEEQPWKIYPMTAKPAVVIIIAMDACTHMFDRHSLIQLATTAVNNGKNTSFLPSSRNIKCSSSSTVDPGNSGLPEAISKKIQPTPL